MLIHHIPFLLMWNKDIELNVSYSTGLCNQASKKRYQISTYYYQFTGLILIESLFNRYFWLCCSQNSQAGICWMTNNVIILHVYDTFHLKIAMYYIINQLIILCKILIKIFWTHQELDKDNWAETELKISLLGKLDWRDGFYNILGVMHSLGFTGCNLQMRTADAHIHHWNQVVRWYTASKVILWVSRL